MPYFSPFASTTRTYQRIAKEYSEDDGERSPIDTRPSTPPDETNSLVARGLRRQALRKHTCGYTLVIMFSLILGTLVGPLFVRFELEKDGYPAPFGSSKHIIKDVVWQRNETFQVPPSVDSEMAWMSLMPKGRGMIRYPKEDKLEKGMIVFHGIHCLYNLHTAFHANAYMLAKMDYESQFETEEIKEHQNVKQKEQDNDGNEGAEQDEGDEEDEEVSAPQESTPPSEPKPPKHHKFPKPNAHHPKPPRFPHGGPASHSSPIFPPRPFKPNPYLDAKLSDPEFTEFLESERMYHCFDYIRQSLMCAADSSLETGEPNGEGEDGEGVDITGWGVKRVCRDFEAVREWAEERRGEEGDGLN